MSEKKNIPTETIEFELKKKDARLVRRVVLLILLIVLLIGSIVGLIGYNYVSKGLKPLDEKSEEKIEVEVPIGSGLTLIANLLEEKKVIKDARIFKYYAKFNNESSFQAGTYTLSPAMTHDELIESLKTGKVYREPVFKVTIPEGLKIEEIARIIEKNTTISEQEFVSYVNNPEVIQQLMTDYPTLLTEAILNEQVRTPLEGYLFPATYPFYEEEPTIETVVHTMLDATLENVTPYMNYLEENDKTVHWLLTFSSLLEKEATQKADRKKIASVFYNRMKVDMPLQTDPTVLYALGEHKDKVLLKDLEVQNPYNTYQNKGLPPGPIANAGASSIEAVVSPDETDYIYFLADKTGENHFTNSYEQHLLNKKKYIDSE